MTQWHDRKEKHEQNFNRAVNRNKHYDFMCRRKLTDEERERFRRKPYTIIHRRKEDSKVDREKEG